MHGRNQIVEVARLALRAAARRTTPYSSVKSRHDFTQAQLVAVLVLRAHTKSTYRGVCELLAIAPVLREAIGLRKVPHWTTLQKFADKPGVPGVVQATIDGLLDECAMTGAEGDVAVDSTGLQIGNASAHYRTRRGGTGGRYVKLSVGVLCGALLPVALVADFGPTVDMKQMPALLEQTASRTRVRRLLADRGYDAEWVHELCRDGWGAESWIPPIRHGPNGAVRSPHRSRMLDLPAVYGKRWHAESFFSALKRTTHSTLSSRKPRAMIAEALFKALAYAVRR